jgi:uncharacterized repeat protein (TIGR02543 family)
MNNKSFIRYYNISLVMISFSLLVSCNYYPLISSLDPINNVVISFDSNGGNELDQISFIVGEAVNMPDDPDKLGYSFDGWYLDGTFSNQINEQTLLAFNINRDITLIAKWDLIDYLLNYILDDGINSALNPISFTIEDSFELDIASKRGYSFTGWYDQAGLNASIVESIISGTSNDITIYANYEMIQYQVSYELYGGYINSNPSSYNVTSDIILNTPYLYGYQFMGWFDNELAYGHPIFKLDQQISTDIELYAKWLQIYKPYIPPYDVDSIYVDPPQLNPVMVIPPYFNSSLIYGNFPSSLVIEGEMSTAGNFYVVDGLEYLPVGNHSLSYEFIPDLTTYDSYLGAIEISVVPREVTFSTQSSSKPYDGLALVSDNVYATCGCTALGHRVEYDVDGSQTQVGISNNYVSNAIIYDTLDVNVSNNYEISYISGTLEVLALIGDPILGLEASNYFQIGNVITQTASSNQATELAWYSNDISIATVNIDTGVVTANGAGTTSIYYISESMHGSSIDIYIYPKTIINNPQIDTVQLGEPLVTPKAFTLPKQDQSIAWSSSVVATATIDQVSGEISPIAVGATNISYVVIDDVNGLMIASGNIDIQTGAYATITNPTITNATVNGDSIYPAGYPIPTAGQSIEWLSSNLEVATINIITGEVVPLSEGTSIISYRTKVDATDQVVYKGQVVLTVLE